MELVNETYLPDNSVNRRTNRLIASLLLLVLYFDDIIRRDTFKNALTFLDHLHNFGADVPLHNDFVQTLRVLRHGCTRSKLLCELLRGLLEVHAYRCMM